MKPGDILRAPVGPFTAKLEVINLDEQTLVGEVRLVELYEKKHKPGNNGFGLCPHCGRGVHEYTRPRMYSRVAYLRHNPIPRLRVIPDRDRRYCSKCSKPGEWYEFKPGSGECTECQT